MIWAQILTLTLKVFCPVPKSKHLNLILSGQRYFIYLLKVVNVPLEYLHTPLLGSEWTDVPNTYCRTTHTFVHIIKYCKHTQLAIETQVFCYTRQLLDTCMWPIKIWFVNTHNVSHTNTHTFKYDPPTDLCCPWSWRGGRIPLSSGWVQSENHHDHAYCRPAYSASGPTPTHTQEFITVWHSSLASW
jgi:hypothetical protein